MAHAQRAQAQAQLEEVEADEEREEPDRLAQLLQQSRFDCVGKQSGYYADQELACEVFHYCQDSVKHSWICPDGFTFHQVIHFWFYYLFKFYLTESSDKFINNNI